MRLSLALLLAAAVIASCAQPQCTVNTDCGDRARCALNRCVSDCRADRDCPGGQTCNLNGECLAPPADARPLDDGSIIDLADPDAPADLGPGAPDVPLDVAPEVSAEVGADAPPEAASDAAPDFDAEVAVVPDASQDLAPDAAPDIAPDVAPDIAPDIAPDASPDAAPDITADADVPCTTGATRSCYTGPTGTLGVGRCRGGTQTCDAAGRWSGCLAEALPMAESCNGADDDCDGATDEALESSACRLAGATAACRMGACAVVACDANLADCDRAPTNGCEADLRGDVAHCGACGRACAAGQVCGAGRCVSAVALPLAVGGAHGCAVLDGARLACWGIAGVYPPGIANAGPRLADGLGGVADVELGLSHSCVVRGAGEVWCWGANASGQLGDGSTGFRNERAPVPGLADATQLAAGGAHTCALRRDGRVSCWGANASGQLGDGTAVTRLTPVPVAAGLAEVTRVVAGASHTCALRRDGAVLCWGANASGQLGDGATTSRMVPTPVPGLSGVVHLAAGDAHTCAVRSDGTVWCWGDNASGQLGDGTLARRTSPAAVPSLTGVAQVEAGTGNTCARRADGAVLCWGDNGFGQLGDGTTSPNRPTPGLVTGLADAERIAFGGFTACARRRGGAVTCWGQNLVGQLGDGSATARSLPDRAVFGLEGPEGCAGASCNLPLDAGGASTCALRPGGALACWGANTNGQLGDGTRVNRHGPVGFPALSDVAAVAVGLGHGCAVLRTGVARCWGYNLGGALGDGTTAQRLSPTDVVGLSDVAEVAVGDSYSCALQRGGGVFCWGGNGYGQLGDGSAVTGRPTPGPVGGATPIRDAVAIATGAYSACAIRAGGALWCWGSNTTGLIGDGTRIARPTPVQVRDPAGTTPLMGVTDVCTGGLHACAVRAGSVLCWGENMYGELGDGTTVERVLPVPVRSLTDVTAITCGTAHTCARRADGTIWCWGNNTAGQVGDGTRTNRPVPAQAFGAGAHSVRAGSSHTCARASDGAVWCWGDNGAGQLGDGGTAAAQSARGPVFGLP